MASGYGTCAEATPDLSGAVSVNGDGDGGLRGDMGVYVLLGSCQADAPLLLLLCKKALELQGGIFSTTEAPQTVLHPFRIQPNVPL